jgi:hypothetical protein
MYPASNNRSQEGIVKVALDTLEKSAKYGLKFDPRVYFLISLKAKVRPIIHSSALAMRPNVLTGTESGRKMTEKLISDLSDT